MRGLTTTAGGGALVSANAAFHPLTPSEAPHLLAPPVSVPIDRVKAESVRKPDDQFRSWWCARSALCGSCRHPAFILVPDACGLTTFATRLFLANEVPLHTCPGEAAGYHVPEQWAGLGLGSAMIPQSRITSPAVPTDLCCMRAALSAPRDNPWAFYGLSPRSVRSDSWSGTFSPRKTSWPRCVPVK
ncbi:hypothetical protein HFP71_37290 [Streptomyces sp. ARC32]